MSVRIRIGRRRFVGALLLAAAAPAIAQDPRASQTQRVARDWLALSDAGDATASWQRAGQKFRNAMTLEEWTKALKAQREPRGKTERRTVVSHEFPRQIPGFEEGEYALVKFRTAFANRPVNEESVTLQREPDGVWRVVGYFIR